MRPQLYSLTMLLFIVLSVKKCLQNPELLFPIVPSHIWHVSTLCSSDPFTYFQVFNQGAVVTDVARCTSLGFEVLGKQGSSVDAAIAAALCLGIVHPHTSGIGG